MFNVFVYAGTVDVVQLYGIDQERKALSTSFHHFQGWSSDLATAVIPFL